MTGRSRPHDSSLGVARPPGDLPPSRTVSLDGHGEIFFRDQPGPADKPPIVLVHGWVVSADLNWFTTYGALEEMGRVIAPDHRGHGRGARHSMPFRLADVADDIAALLRAEGTGPAIIVGYSMGGPLTQLLWQRHPDVVAGVVLCATAAHFNFSTVTALGWRFITLYQLGQRLLPRTWIERVLLTQAQDAVGPNLLRRAAPGISELSPLLPWVVGELQRGEIEDLAEAGRELSRFDSRGWITGIDVPSARLGFGWSHAYLAYDLIGVALAAGLYRVVHPQEYAPGAATTLGAKLCSECLGTVFLVLTVVVFLVIVGILVRTESRHKLALGALTVILAGAAGNFIDRVRYGFVVDFIDMTWASCTGPPTTWRTSGSPVGWCC